MRSVDDEEYVIDLVPGPMAKVALIGQSGVGKSCLFHALSEGKFEFDTASTVGADFRPLVMRTGSGEPVNVALWDTAGQERCRAVSRMHVRGSDVVLAVYDVNDEASKEDLLSGAWQSFDELNRDPDIRQCPVIVIGAKFDAVHGDEMLFMRRDGTTFVPTTEQLSESEHVKEFAAESGYDHGILTSSFTGYNIEELKQIIAEYALLSMNRKEEQQVEGRVRPSAKRRNKKSKDVSEESDSCCVII